MSKTFARNPKICDGTCLVFITLASFFITMKKYKISSEELCLAGYRVYSKKYFWYVWGIWEKMNYYLIDLFNRN
jgi:hypothetical protein